MNFVRRDKIFVLLVILLLAGCSFLFIPKVHSAGGASLYFSPASGQKVVGDTFAVVVRVNTGGKSINAGEGSVAFASDKLQVIAVSKAGSVFSLWTVEPSFSNANGKVEFAGGIPSPGYIGANGVIVTINFKAKTSTAAGGSAEVVMASGTVLANDGEGTNILSSLGKASFTISPASIPSQTLPLPPETKPAIPAQSILIKSSTHPDQEKWYADNAPVFNWELPRGVEAVSYLVTDDPTSNPGTTPDGLVDQAKFTDITDGVNYFHLRFKEGGIWGPISHFKFQIDTNPPQEFEAGNSATASAKVVVPGGGFWNKFMDIIWQIFRNWMSLITGAVLAILARKFFGFLRKWKKFKKN